VYFLIDYENVRNAGMQGTEYLLPDDHVIVFYSKAAPNMEARHLTDIKKSGCGFSTCKLLKVRKNGLDFYIATKVGEIVGAGYRGNIAIISRDEGFQSLREYWANRADPPRRVLVSESIERGIVSANMADRRTAQIRQRMKMTDIGGFHAACEERNRLRRLLEESFAGTGLTGRMEEIEALVKSGGSPKVIYLDALRRFGRKDGLEVYRRLKSSGEL